MARNLTLEILKIWCFLGPRGPGLLAPLRGCTPAYDAGFSVTLFALCIFTLLIHHFNSTSHVIPRYPVQSCPALFCPVLSYRATLPYPTLPYPTLRHPAPPHCHVLTSSSLRLQVFW